MRVLGVDPGLTRCGLGVVEAGPGRSVRMIAVGVVRTPPGDDPAERLLTLQTEIDAWLAEHRPDAVAVERVFAKANIKGIMGTAQASAVPMLAAARLGLPLALHTPTEVKAAVTGNGRADKAQVTAMITRILGLETPPRPADAADALALAVCHLWRGQSDARLQAAARGNTLQQLAQDAARAPRNRLEELHAAHSARPGAGAPRAQAPAARRPPPATVRRGPLSVRATPGSGRPWPTPGANVSATSESANNRSTTSESTTSRSTTSESTSTRSVQ